MDFELLGILLDRKPYGRGAQEAPIEIRRILPQMETFISQVDLEEHGLVDLGNILPKKYSEMIAEAKLRLDHKFPDSMVQRQHDRQHGIIQCDTVRVEQHRQSRIH